MIWIYVLSSGKRIIAFHTAIFQINVKVYLDALCVLTHIQVICMYEMYVKFLILLNTSNLISSVS